MIPVIEPWSGPAALAAATNTPFSSARHMTAFSLYGLAASHQRTGSEPSSVVTKCGTKTTWAPASASDRAISG